MTRTLLPVFSAFKGLTCIYNKEEKETFYWLPEDIRHDYEMAKSALDRIPGSREWLKACTFEAEDPPFFITAFGSHHTVSSATHLAWNYKSLLNDWDGFVLKSKESLAHEEYDKQQLTSTDIQSFLRLNYKNPSISPVLLETREKLIKNEVERLRSFFNIHHDYETTYTMLMELADEKSKDATVLKI